MPLHVLMVEDSEDDALLLAEKLRGAGYDPKWARVETEPDYRARLNGQLDIIFCDFTLPKFTTRRAIQILHETGLDVPFVIVSGTIGEDTAVECMQLGASDYLVKDRLGRLGQAIGHALEERRLRQEKQHTEATLLATQKRLQHVLSASPAVTYLLEVRGGSPIPIWISENISSLIGFEVAEVLLPGWWLKHVHPADQERINAEQAVLRAQGHLVQEYRVQCRDGSYRWVRDEKKLLRSASGYSSEIVGSWSDITDRKSLEAQLWQAQKLELLGQLAGGVAHDFNNILAVVQGNASLLMVSENVNKEDMDLAEQICLAAERGAGLSRQLLTFSRKQVMQLQRLNLNEAIGNLTKMLKRVLGADVALNIHSSPDLPEVFADVVMMEQVLMNLVVNARDAMPGGGQLIIETRKVIVDQAYCELNPDSPRGEFICIAVSDTGCGIPPEIQSRIFEPFFTTKEAGKGTGLGLSTVYGIIRQHGGWIKVYSEVGKGSVFRIYVPVAGAGQEKTSDKVGEVKMRGGNETILLVEDETHLRSVTRNILERHGYQVLEAETGPAAVEIWKANAEHINLLLTDMMMPGGMTGIQLAERLAAERSSLKVIYTSAYSAEIIGKDSRMSEGSNFLQKPYTLRKLMITVRDCLDGIKVTVQ